MLTEAELLAVIGHELGHVKCQHMLYKTMAYILRYLGVEALNNLLPAGMGRLASLPLQLAILHWERMAEFSCDRAALLVVQDETVVANALAKLAGGSQKIMPELNLSQILQQAREYDEADEQFLEKLFKVNMMLLQTHPFPIVRAKEIVDWSATEQYRAIMRGDYAVDPPGAASQPGEPVVRVCSHCKQTVGRAAATCPACGQAVKKGHLACGQCGLKVFAGWSACPGCGSRLAEGSVN
jgi:RNA polymerase subunit RPABC4/transcription elongation factor Spt4